MELEAPVNGSYLKEKDVPSVIGRIDSLSFSEVHGEGMGADTGDGNRQSLGSNCDLEASPFGGRVVASTKCTNKQLKMALRVLPGGECLVEQAATLRR